MKLVILVVLSSMLVASGLHVCVHIVPLCRSQNYNGTMKVQIWSKRFWSFRDTLVHEYELNHEYGYWRTQKDETIEFCTSNSNGNKLSKSSYLCIWTRPCEQSNSLKEADIAKKVEIPQNHIMDYVGEAHYNIFYHAVDLYSQEVTDKYCY